MQSNIPRAMSIGDLLDAAFRLYRLHFARFISITAIALVPFAVLLLFVQFTPTTRLLVSLVQNILIMALVGGALVAASVRAYWGKSCTLADVYRRGARRYWSLLGATLLEALLLVLPATVIFVFLGIALRPARANIQVLLILVLASVVLFIGPRFAVTFPAITTEEAGAWRGLRRSWALTSGLFWHTAGVFITSALLTLLIDQLPGIGVGYVLRSIVHIAQAPWLTTVQTTLTWIGLIITLPFHYLVVTLLYYDLRVRTEGYDLERATEDLGVRDQGSGVRV